MKLQHGVDAFDDEDVGFGFPELADDFIGRLALERPELAPPCSMRPPNFLAAMMTNPIIITGRDQNT